MRLILKSILYASTSIDALTRHLSQYQPFTKHPHRSVSMMFQSKRKSKQYSFHNACKRIAHQNLDILHETNSAIHLVRVYVFRRSQPTPIKISTMHKHPHRSVSKILQSERQSKPNSFHDECKRVAHQHLIILHETNSAIYLERVYVYRRSQPTPIKISTMHKHPHRSVSKILQSERQSKPNSFHDECKRVAHQHLIILHETNSAIYLERVYVYRRSQPTPITISTMHKHPHRSASMMLQSERQSKPNSCHNACKRIAHQNLKSLHETNSAIFLVRFYVYRRSQPPPITISTMHKHPHRIV